MPTNKILKYYDKCVMYSYITRNVLPIIIYENYYIPKWLIDKNTKNHFIKQ